MISGRIKLIAVCVLLYSSPSFALTVLKNVKLGDSGTVQLVFDQKVQKKDLKTEFFRDIVQVSVNNSNVYPAKIFSVDNSDLRKVFAYQYTPRLIRCRLTMGGDATNYEKRVNVSVIDNVVTIKLIDAGPAQDKLALQAAKANRPGEKDDEKSLLKNIMQDDHANKLTGFTQEKGAKSVGKLAGGPSILNPFKAFSWLAIVLMSFLATAVVLKKLQQRKPQNRLAASREKGIRGILGKITQNPFFKGDKMIEVVANHYLGPKKSIAVVKIKKRMMVLAVTNESINLISELPSGEEPQLDSDMLLDELLDEPLPRARGATASTDNLFSDLLSNEVSKPQTRPVEKDTRIEPKINLSSSQVREKIREKIQGMKSI